MTKAITIATVTLTATIISIESIIVPVLFERYNPTPNRAHPTYLA